MHDWFKYLFEQRMDAGRFCHCFECGKPMHENMYKETSTIYSHLIEKKRYPQHAGDPENLVIVCPDCHNLFSMEPKKAKKQYLAAQEFRKKHNL